MTKLVYSFLILFAFSHFAYSQSDDDAKYLEYFSEAQRFLLLEETDTAKFLLQKCLDINPNSGAANYSLARIFFAEQNEVLAITYLESAVELDDNNLCYLRFLADMYEYVYEVEQARNIYSQILELSPYVYDFEDAASFYNSIIYYDNELEVVELMIERFGNTYEAFSRKVEVCFEMQDKECVIDNCEKLILNFPNNPDAYLLYIKYLFIYDLYDEALNIVQIGRSKFSDNKNFDLYAAEYYFEVNVDSTYFYLNNVLENDYAGGNKVVLLMQNNADFFTYNIFESKLDTLINLLFKNYESNFEVISFVADFYFKHNKYYDAISSYEVILKLNMTDFDSYVSLLNLYNRFDLWNELDSLSNVGSELFPAQPIMYLFNGISAFHTDDLDDAYEALIFGNSIVFDQPHLKAFFSFYLSQYFRLSDDESNENLYYNNAISFASKNCDLLAYFAFYFAKNEIYKEKSMNLIGQCIMSDLHDISPYIAYIYAYVLYKFNDYDGALNYIQIAISNSKYPNFTHYELLGNVYFKLENFDLANQSWLKSVNFGNKFLNKEL